jgi:Spy/CpxP family protein refolding chaperone
MTNARKVAMKVVCMAGIMGLAMAVWGPADAAAGTGRGMKNVLMSIPNLNADQKSRITHLTNTVKMQTAPLGEQIWAARKNMARLWAAEPLDKQMMSAKQGELDGAMTKVRTLWADFFVQLHDVLTPPQRAWLAARAPGLYGSDAGPDLGMAPPRDCPCGEPQPAQHPGPLQEQ